MISWMQRHNKYLVWTIWIATIAFIGAGFVGWGQYNMGTKASNIGKVGDVEIKHSHFRVIYSGIYNQYNQMFQGKLDQETAKKLNIEGQAYGKLISQAKILNLANEMGIIVSDKELQKTFEQLEAFQKDGQFQRELYDSYLASQNLNAKTFEEMLRDEMRVSKTLKLLNITSLPLESETLNAINTISDKVEYVVLSLSDTHQQFSNEDLKTFWQENKESYQTTRKYTVTTLWTSTDIEVTEEELKKHYEQNAFNYTDSEGKTLSFEDAKADVEKEVKIKNSKKRAMKDFIALKKGEATQSETIELDENDDKFPRNIWAEIASKNVNELIKPKIVNDQYVSIKVDKIVQPKIMSFEEAKTVVEKEYKEQTQRTALNKLAEATLKNFDEANTTTSDFLTQSSKVSFEGLTEKESLHFLEKLFTSSQENGIISLLDKVIVYSVIEQKFDKNEEMFDTQMVKQVKQGSFETTLLELLSEKFKTETY